MGQSVSNIRHTVNDITNSMSNTVTNDDKAGSLKLEAQRITTFSGTNEEWPKWKNRSLCAFEGSGYDKILTDISFARCHPKMNKIVYSQLATATIDGTAHHIVAQLSDTKDGHGAWTALSEWYDGDSAKAETAEELRVKLQALTLSQGMDAMAYINKFLIYLRDLVPLLFQRLITYMISSPLSNMLVPISLSLLALSIIPPPNPLHH